MRTCLPNIFMNYQEVSAVYKAKLLEFMFPWRLQDIYNQMVLVSNHIYWKQFYWTGIGLRTQLQKPVLKKKNILQIFEVTTFHKKFWLHRFISNCVNNINRNEKIKKKRLRALSESTTCFHTMQKNRLLHVNTQ